MCFSSPLPTFLYLWQNHIKDITGRFVIPFTQFLRPLKPGRCYLQTGMFKHQEGNSPSQWKSEVVINEDGSLCWTYGLVGQSLRVRRLMYIWVPWGSCKNAVWFSRCGMGYESLGFSNSQLALRITLHGSDFWCKRSPRWRIYMMPDLSLPCLWPLDCFPGGGVLISFSPSHIVPPPSDSTPNIHSLPKTLAFTFFTATKDDALTFKHFCWLYLSNCLNTYKYDFRSHFLPFNRDELSVTGQGSLQELL